jgi:hypothetical protein
MSLKFQVLVAYISIFLLHIEGVLSMFAITKVELVPGICRVAKSLFELQTSISVSTNKVTVSSLVNAISLRDVGMFRHILIKFTTSLVRSSQRALFVILTMFVGMNHVHELLLAR